MLSFIESDPRAGQAVRSFACEARDAGICYNFVLRMMIGAGLYDYTFWKTGTYAS